MDKKTTSKQTQCHELRKQGKSLRDIAFILDISKSTVQYHLRVVDKKFNGAWSEKDEQALKKQFLALSKMLNRTPSVVLKKLNDIERESRKAKVKRTR